MAVPASQLQHIRLGDLLVGAGRVSPEDVEAALTYSKRSGQRLGEVLLQQTGVRRADIYAALWRQRVDISIEKLADLPEWNQILNDAEGPMGVTKRDASFACLTHSDESANWPRSSPRQIPYFVLCTREARDSIALKTVTTQSAVLGYAPIGYLYASQELLQALYDTYDAQRGGGRIARAASADDDGLHREYDEIAHAAFKRGSSDIHITNQFGRAYIKFRVHGLLEDYRDLPTEKVMRLMASAYNTLTEEGSTKDGYNSARCQDAVIERTFPEGLVRFRYSGMPLAPNGADHTLRIIPIGVAAKRKSMADLGYSPDQCDALDRIFGNSSGLIAFVGTTGSGKSTTMANKLMAVAAAHPGKKIRTIEEPVEYRIEGAYQTPVVRVYGDKRDFMTVMRAVLRADPDILGIGETRDYDTAELVLHAVRSGHLAVTSIHAESALGVYDRLASMGISRLDLASVGLVAGFVYQKLIPVLCPDCKVPVKDLVDNKRLHPLFRRIEVAAGGTDGIYFHRENGCAKCSSRGVIGRTVCAEILRPTKKMLKPIAESDSLGLWEMWRSTRRTDPADMTGRTAMEHAIWKMTQGIVDPSHVEDAFKFLDENEDD